ncbi:hypothetical protein Tco_0080372 [Tanacetum coccineum]
MTVKFSSYDITGVDDESMSSECKDEFEFAGLCHMVNRFSREFTLRGAIYEEGGVQLHRVIVVTLVTLRWTRYFAILTVHDSRAVFDCMRDRHRRVTMSEIDRTMFCRYILG